MIQKFLENFKICHIHVRCTFKSSNTFVSHCISCDVTKVRNIYTFHMGPRVNVTRVHTGREDVLSDVHSDQTSKVHSRISSKYRRNFWRCCVSLSACIFSRFLKRFTWPRDGSTVRKGRTTAIMNQKSECTGAFSLQLRLPRAHVSAK